MQHAECLYITHAMEVKVKFLKNGMGAGFGYFAEDECLMESKQASALAESGHVMLMPDDSLLPADIPARDVLSAAGINSMEQLAGITDFIEIKGIGKATAEKITLYLSALKK